MKPLGSFYSTRDILAITPSDIARVGHVRMRGHCENSDLDTGNFTDNPTPALWQIPALL
jgi:hypothetical protein